MKTTQYQGIIFDMDGTLTVPTLDFTAMRNDIGLGSGDVVKEIAALPPDRQKEAWRIVERHEAKARQNMHLQPGTTTLLANCRSAGIRLGIVTRNTPEGVHTFCETFDLQFDCILTRAFPFMKPHPAPILHILEDWNLAGKDTLMIGDYVHDINCGREAGTDTCFYQNAGYPDYGKTADFTVHSMQELSTIIFH
ncbi:MAG: HAD family hydrolase [Kiritimatiellae bacterium]|nr:HAD family hydrolase [Kiritimatiellia bacterium]